MTKPSRLGVACLVVLGSGCASIPSDWGQSNVNSMVVERRADIDFSSTDALESLLSEPIDSEQAVRIALFNNPDIKAIYARLGHGAAAVYRASRISNPVISFAALDPANVSGVTRLSYGLIGSFTELITLPQRKNLAAAEFAALKAEVGAEILTLAADVEQAFYQYQTAEQVKKLRKLTASAAAVSAQLAEQFFNAGNISPRQLAQAKSGASQAKLLALSSEADAFGARQSLADLLGLSVADDWSVSGRLSLPGSIDGKVGELLQYANANRLDFEAAKQRAQVIAERKKFVAWSRWVGAVNIGVDKERESDGEKLFGPQLEIEIPIFNQNLDGVIEADAEMHTAAATLRKLAISIDNEVRLADMAVTNARYRIDEIRDVLIPTRVAATRQAQLEQNFMLIGAFELIQSKQLEYDSYEAYINAIGDYWLARVQLTRAVGNSLPGAAESGRSYLDVQKLMAPKQSNRMHQHSHQSGHGESK